MSPRRARVLAGSSFAVSAALSAVATVFLVLAWETPLRPAEFGFKGFAIAWSVVVGSVGAVLAARRPSNPIGWIFCGMGVVSGVLALASEYARWALIDLGGDPPGGLLAAWIVEWIWIPLIAALGIVAAIFPDGRFISSGWRRMTWAAIAVTLVPTLLIALIPELTVYEGFDNPVGVGSGGLTTVAQLSVILLLPVVAAGTAAAVRRFRRSRGEERLQLKWLGLSTGVLAALFAVYGVLVFITGTASPEGEALA
jgi:hypothetical protein